MLSACVCSKCVCGEESSVYNTNVPLWKGCQYVWKVMGDGSAAAWWCVCELLCGSEKAFIASSLPFSFKSHVLCLQSLLFCCFVCVCVNVCLRPGGKQSVPFWSECEGLSQESLAEHCYVKLMPPTIRISTHITGWLFWKFFFNFFTQMHIFLPWLALSGSHVCLKGGSFESNK